MSVEVSRSLAEIDNKVKTLNKSLSDSNKTTKELDKSLKLNPKDIESAEKKMKVLESSVGTATQKVALLKQKQLEANKAIKNGDISASEYAKIELAVLKAETEVKKLNSEIAKTQKLKIDQTSASFDNLTKKLNTAQAASQKLSKVCVGIVATLSATIGAFVVVGDELHDVSKRFDISAEKLQLQRNLYSKTTDDAKNYDKALSSVSSMMTSLAKGSGSEYEQVLSSLGVSTVDVSGKTKSSAQVYDELMLSLSSIANETERASIATTIFGENGLNVAEVAGLTRDEINTLNQELASNGIISSESAEKADSLASQIDGIKQQLMAVSAELFTALMPVITMLVDFLKETVIPILMSIANWFKNMSPEQQKLVFFVLMLIIILPKLISVVTAIVGVVKAITIASYAASGGIGAVSAASLPLQPILLAVAAAILIVVLLFAMLSGKSKDVTSELKNQQKQLSSVVSQYSNMETDMNTTTGVVSQNTNTNIVQHNVKITAEGNTPISQESADLVADSLADKINMQLGGKI